MHPPTYTYTKPVQHLENLWIIRQVSNIHFTPTVTRYVLCFRNKHQIKLVLVGSDDILLKNISPIRVIHMLL